jgi:TrfA protein
MFSSCRQRLRKCIAKVGSYAVCWLIRAFGYDPETGEAVVHLNEHLPKLFDNYTLISWEDRLALGSDQLAKWLHAYYSTHAEAYPLKVETVMKACGSEAKFLYHFRADLKSALDTVLSYLYKPA